MCVCVCVSECERVSECVCVCVCVCYVRSLVGEFSVKSLWESWQERVAPDNHHITVQSLQ